MSWVTSEAARELSRPHNKTKLREVRERLYACSDEPAVVAFVEKGKLADPRSEVTELLSRPLLDALEERGLVGYLRSLKDVIRRYYSTKPGRSDEIPHCVIEWDLSVIPLFIEFRFTFDDDKRTKRFLVHVDCMKDDDIVSLFFFNKKLNAEVSGIDNQSRSYTCEANSRKLSCKQMMIFDKRSFDHSEILGRR